MASDKFQIESYKVRVSQSPGVSQRNINLTSPDLSHGIRVRASIIFLPFDKGTSFEALGGVGVVTNINGLNYDGNDLTIYCQPEAFDSFYHVLNVEKPVYLSFNYQDLPNAKPDETTKLVTSIELSTDTELPGDADKDPLFLLNFPLSLATK